MADGGMGMPNCPISLSSNRTERAVQLASPVAGAAVLVLHQTPEWQRELSSSHMGAIL